MCLHQTGSDFFGHAYPLFSQGLGGGYYTAPYLYGELLFTSVFGNSTYAFRAFLALVTTGTIYFLYLWLKKRTNQRIAMLAVLFASISPWVFQFSRIAWDPPLAPFFLVLALWCFDLKKRGDWIWGAIAIALAGYSYPPCRIQVVILLLALPGLSCKKKIQIFGVFAFANIPMLYRAMMDPAFTARGRMLALWSGYPMNPYHDAGIVGLVYGFVTQFAEHFTPDFLFFHGDHNLRHSTGLVGTLSYVEGLILISGSIYFCVYSVKRRSIEWNSLMGFAIIGIASGIAPASLTWESVPHALRAIGAWPFYMMLTALVADHLLKKVGEWRPRMVPNIQRGIWGASLIFSLYFLSYFFVAYPAQSIAWFQDDESPLGSAYRKMTEYQAFCSDLREFKRN
jgi:hypothetical protein